MATSQEPSYYEIALTNRQVLGFFVVLLLCVVGAFFSGIWLGKKQSTGFAALADTEAVVEATTDGEESLAELNFFTDEKPAPATKAATKSKRDQRPAEREEVPAAGSAGTTLREDVEAATPTRRAAAETPSEEPPATPTRRAAAESESSESVAPTTPAVATGGFVIQVFSSQDGDQARKLKDRLIAGGYPAFVLPEMVDGRTMHRVRVGPFTERAEAERTAPGVAKAFQVDTWITRNE